MNWFIAKISFQIITAADSEVGQFEEQFRLVNAATSLQAYQKAVLLGQQEEESFLNAQNRPVHWKFVGITDLKELQSLTDGAEVFSTITEHEQAADYLQIASQRHLMITERSCHNSLLAIAV